MSDTLQSQLDARYQSNIGESTIHTEVHTFPINEWRHRAQVIEEVKKEYTRLPRERDYARVHLGFAGFYNFDIAATGRHDAMVLCDVNLDQVRFWNTIIQLLAQSETPSEFRKAFAAQYVKNSGDHYWHGFRLLPPDDAIKPEVRLRHESSDMMFAFSADAFLKYQDWINNKRMYTHLHEMAKAGNIAAVSLNAFHEESCMALGDAIADSTVNGKPAVLATVYGSNIYDLLVGHQKYASLLEDMRSFYRIAEDMKKHADIDVFYRDQCQPGTERFTRLCEMFGEAMKRNNFGVRGAEMDTMIDANIEPLTQVFLDVYRSIPFKDLKKVKDSISIIGAEREVRNGRNIYAEIGNRLFNEITQREGVAPELIHKRYVEFMPQAYYASDNGLEADYAALRSLAKDERTKIYCTSTFHYPLVAFEGPDSSLETREWRYRMYQEGQDVATCIPGDQIVGRL